MFCYEQNFFYVLSTLSTLHYHYKINKGRHLEGFDDPGLDLLCQGLGGPPLLLPLGLHTVHQEDIMQPLVQYTWPPLLLPLGIRAVHQKDM